jgi:hypothetical protein
MRMRFLTLDVICAACCSGSRMVPIYVWGLIAESKMFILDKCNLQYLFTFQNCLVVPTGADFNSVSQVSTEHVLDNTEPEGAQGRSPPSSP